MLEKCGKEEGKRGKKEKPRKELSRRRQEKRKKEKKRESLGEGRKRWEGTE